MKAYLPASSQLGRKWLDEERDTGIFGGVFFYRNLDGYASAELLHHERSIMAACDEVIIRD